MSLLFLARLPLHGHYLRDLFPGFVVGGAAMALSFVPVTIASVTGVASADAGIASGLVNTSRQIGGAIGIAVTSAIAMTATSRYVDSHAGATAVTGQALDHGFRMALYVLAAVAAAAAVIAVRFIGARSRRADLHHLDEGTALEDAA